MFALSILAELSAAVEEAFKQDVDSWCKDVGIAVSSANPASSVRDTDEKCATTIKYEDLDLTTTYGTCIFNGNRFVDQFSVTYLILTFNRHLSLLQTNCL